MEKQIEEMAKVLNEENCTMLPCEGCAYYNYDADICMRMFEATALYNAGYRKSSDVAEDIIRILRAAGINEHRYPVVAELKKKYTEGEG